MRYVAFTLAGKKVLTVDPAVKYNISSDLLYLYSADNTVVAIVPIVNLGLLETREDQA